MVTASNVRGIATNHIKDIITIGFEDITATMLMIFPPYHLGGGQAFGFVVFILSFLVNCYFQELWEPWSGLLGLGD